MIVYLHGFGSDGNAFKARLIRRIYPEIKLHSPDLPLEPQKAVESVTSYIKKIDASEKCLLIGSSLGGFYALHLNACLQIPAVLLNPTVQPHKDLRKRLQNNENLKSEFVTIPAEAYLNQLSHLLPSPDNISRDCLWVYLNKDDEALDYRIAEKYFQSARCKLFIQPDGKHVFLNFTKVLPDIIKIHHNL